MEVYREATEWFHVYANEPGRHGRLMATVATESLAKQYLLELCSIPLDAWEARSLSEDRSRVNLWVSRYEKASSPVEEESGTAYTIERVSVVKAILKPGGVICSESEEPQ
ncbi:MAG: hypothetical protein AAFY26_13885 [Cyanobacteria bacterium J06638_22]